MKKVKIKNPRILIFLITGMALLVAIITSSIAWFNASGSVSVYTSDLQLTAAESAALQLTIPELYAEYERYMGETGTEYDGQDSPYLVKYTPVIINYIEDNNSAGKFMTYSFDPDTSYIQPVLAGSSQIEFSAEDLWDNFVMNLITLEAQTDPESGAPVLDENEEVVYDEVETYYGENGYFRNSAGELLQLTEGLNYFAIEIYFQGDVGYHLLLDTQDDIDESYSFDYTDESFMFSTFHLNAVFNILSQNSLVFSNTPYDVDHEQITSHSTYTSPATMEVTGFTLTDKDGNARAYPVPEFTTSDFSYYFVDWASMEYDEDHDRYDWYRYRSVKADGTPDDVYTLGLRPLRGSTEYLYSLWGESYSVKFDANDGDDDHVTECYARPRSNYYSRAATIGYDTGTKTASIVNPNNSTTGYVTSNTITPPTRDGYRFLGWSTSKLNPYAADANLSSVPYFFTAGNSYTYNFATSGNAHDVTLYAVWQELGVNVTIVVDSVWGHNYATVVADHVTYGGTNYALVEDATNHCYTVTIEVPKHTALSAITISGGVATITSTSATRNLTLRTWNYYEGGIYYSNTDYPLDIEDDVTLYAMWNERAERIVTLDVNMYSSAVLYNYGTIDVASVINVEHYSLMLDDTGNPENYTWTKTFSDENRNNITVKMLEGMTLADANLTVEWHRHGTGMGSNSFEGWYTGVGAKENDMATTSWSTLNYSATKYNTSTAITADIQLWVRFD